MTVELRTELEHPPSKTTRAVDQRRTPQYRPVGVSARIDVPWLPAMSVPYFLLIGAPLIGLVLRAALGGGFVAALGRPVVLDALRLSGVTASIAVVVTVVIGSPVALFIARHRGPGRSLFETMVDLPIVLPPTVAGLALLITLGRRGLLGGALDIIGVELPFTTAAVVIAQLFVSAPLYVRAAIIGFGNVPREISEAAELDGAGQWIGFRKIIVPLTSPVLLGGAVMTWARAVGEFGATIMFAGDFPGRTETMPLAIYGAFERDLDASIGLAICLVLASGLVILAFRAITQRRLVEMQRALNG
jgi:molybdate transport system permease protein